jgi:hypothetical protein
LAIVPPTSSCPVPLSTHAAAKSASVSQVLGSVVLGRAASRVVGSRKCSYPPVETPARGAMYHWMRLSGNFPSVALKSER